MKKDASARIASLFALFLATHILMPTDSFSSPGRSQSRPPALEGTEWKAQIVFQQGSVFGTGGYVFAKQQNVKCVIAIHGVIGSLDLDKAIPPDLASAVGTYEQDGSSIHLEFSGHTIDAILKGDTMEGFMTVKESGKRFLWDATKASKTLAEEPASDIENHQRAKDRHTGFSDEDAASLLTELQLNKCLPKHGVLRAKMRDGSIRRIDLSQADEITIEPQH